MRKNIAYGIYLNLLEAELKVNTDVHPTTLGEFRTAESIYNYLSENGVNVKCGETVFELNNYEEECYTFVGNEARNVGTKYVKPDGFEVYFPKFDTDFELISYENGLYKTGSWKDAAVNNYDDLGKSMYNYYIVNFGQWPQPIYSLINNTDSDTEILLISDSTSLRTFSYLALCCKKITFVDTRYSSENHCVRNELLKIKSYRRRIFKSKFIEVGGIRKCSHRFL